MKMKRLLSALASVILCVLLVSCGGSKTINEDITYSVYENDNSDFISFYLTTDLSLHANAWTHSIDGDDAFRVFYQTDETSSTGFLGLGREVQSETLILRPISEGSAKVTFSASGKDGELEKSFSLTVKRDSDGIFRITVK